MEKMISKKQKKLVRDFMVASVLHNLIQAVLDFLNGFLRYFVSVKNCDRTFLGPMEKMPIPIVLSVSSVWRLPVYVLRIRSLVDFLVDNDHDFIGIRYYFPSILRNVLCFTMCVEGIANKSGPWFDGQPIAFDANGFAQMYVFNTCKAFIRTIPTLRYDSSRAEDLDTEGEDHVADETRYFLMSRPIKPRQRAEPDKFNTGPLHLFLDLERGELRRAGEKPRMEVLKK